MSDGMNAVSMSIEFDQAVPRPRAIAFVISRHNLAAWCRARIVDRAGDLFADGAAESCAMRLGAVGARHAGVPVVHFAGQGGGQVLRCGICPVERHAECRAAGTALLAIDDAGDCEVQFAAALRMCHA